MLFALLAVGAYLVIVGWLAVMLNVAINDYIPNKVSTAIHKGGMGFVVFGVLELVIVTGIGLVIWIF